MRNSNVLLRVCVSLVAVLLLATAGCGKTEAEKYDADENTLFVNSDSTLVSTIVGTLDKEYYDVSELEEYTKTEIEDFNYYELREALTFVGVEGDKNKVKVIIKYANAEDYYSFNQEELYISTVRSAMDDGYLFETDFVEYKELDDVALADAVYDTGKRIAIMTPTEETTIKLPGKVLYVSGHVDKIDKKTVQIPANCRSYIIYE
ncbi:MAG: hypothetical protein IJW18_00235 [Lachnospiraceae bacterium]|nr:hypothetical protein [Lachnospiraceae bacterium]